MLGNTRLTWVPDGAAHFKPNVWFPATEVSDWQERHPYAIDEDSLVCASLGALLVQTPEHTVLVDAGIGEKHLEIELGRTGGGAFLKNLLGLGVKPSDIDAVVYTHFHVDHIGWTTVLGDDGYELRFVNAKHVVHSAEWAHWAGQDAPLGMPLEAMERPLENRVELVDDSHAVVPGVTLMHAPGHTPGHSCIVISSGQERAIVSGDAIHSPAQVPERWRCHSDADSDQAADTRETLFNEWMKPNTSAVGSHFPNSVFGRVILSERKTQWVDWETTS